VSASADTQPSDLVMLTESEVFGIYRYQLVDGTYERVPITTTTTEHHYVTQNGKVVRETIGTGETAQVLDFTYDADGRPFALTYTNGTADPVTYYYVLNLQGDVVKLVEHARKGRVYYLNTVAEYTYDAWGKPLSTTDGEGNSVANTHIAKLNPLRYRGYYFDMETGFYYLQSRYYDPTLRRFINADSYQSTGQGILGTNMFAYCNNCPVAFTDETGHMAGIENWNTLMSDGTTNSYYTRTMKPGPSPRKVLKLAMDLDITTAYNQSYNCYGAAIGKRIVATPKGYIEGMSAEEVFSLVQKDLGGEKNCIRVNSIDSSVPEGWYMVALMCSPKDFHFIRRDEIGWYDKRGSNPFVSGRYISSDMVDRTCWEGLMLLDEKLVPDYHAAAYFRENGPIYFLIRMGWDE